MMISIAPLTLDDLIDVFFVLAFALCFAYLFVVSRFDSKVHPSNVVPRSYRSDEKIIIAVIKGMSISVGSFCRTVTACLYHEYL